MSSWFFDYCNMSEDDRYLYEEFYMDGECKNQLNTYRRLYDAVKLMSLEYEKQIKELPKNINIPEEIALLFDDEVIAVMDDLYSKGILSLDNCLRMRDIEKKLSIITKSADRDLWTLDALKYANEWEECRKEAKSLLEALCQL